MLPYELVVFDCDGVLVDSERLTVAIEARMLTELGSPHTPEDVVRRFVGRSSEAMLAEVAAELGAETARLFDERSTAEVHAAFDAELVAVPGVSEVLDWLDELGVTTCVASSGSHAKMRRTLGLTGLHERLDGRIFSAEDVAHGKPAPDLFLRAAQALDVPPGRCAVVEDSVFGVRAALAAGMTAFGFAGGLTAAEVLAGAGALVFHQMADLPGLLQEARTGRAQSRR